MLNAVDLMHHQHIEHIMNEGHPRMDRTGTGTKTSCGRMLKFNLWQKRLPFPSTKELIFRSAFFEMLWFVSGDTDIDFLKDNNVGIWDSWLIPGTARYREKVHAELNRELYGFFNLAYQAKHSTFSPVVANGGTPEFKCMNYRVVDGIATEEECGNEMYTVAFNVHSGEVTIQLNEKARKGYDMLGWAQNADPSKSTEHYQARWLCEFIGLNCQALSGGSIGKGGYGKAWRSWEDTRMVSETELPEMIRRGYEVVGAIPYESDFQRGRVGRVFTVYREIDQLANAIEKLKTNPDDRRIIVNAWNPAMIEDAALPPCHLYYQFWTRRLTLNERAELLNEQEYAEFTAACNGKGHAFTNGAAYLNEHGVPERALQLCVLLRSADCGLGTPFNAAQYALLAHMVAQVVGMEAEAMTVFMVDAHIYDNHQDGLELQLTRESMPDSDPRLVLNPAIKDIDGFTYDDIRVDGYTFHPAIKMPVAV